MTDLYLKEITTRLFKKSRFTLEEIEDLEYALKRALIEKEAALKEKNRALIEKEAALKEKEEAALKEKEDAKKKLNSVLTLFRRQVTCKICKHIYIEPTDLPCSNSICKSHFNEFNKQKCQFCNQHHEIALETIKPNESLNEILEKCLHLTENEIEIKIEIEKLINQNKSLTEELNQSEVQSELLCHDSFAKIEGDIDLQREELKKKIDEICFELIDKVKLCKFKFEFDLKTNQAKQVLTLTEINQIETKFEQEMRLVEFPKETLQTHIKKLNANSEALDGKLSVIRNLSDKIKACKFLAKTIDFDAELYGVLNISGFEREIQSPNDEIETKKIRNCLL